MTFIFRKRVVAAFTLERIGELDATHAQVDEDDESLQSLLAMVPGPGRT